MALPFWTEEEVATLQRMRGHGAEPKQIGETLGRTVVSVWRKLKQVRVAAERAEAKVAAGLKARRPLRLWTTEEIDVLHRMRDAGHMFTDIDRALDRGIGSSATKYGELHPSGAIKPIAGYDRTGVSHDLLRERYRRMALEHRDLTAAFFGDPLPGRSALDQRRSDAR
jgi:hypothetical protein